MIHYKFSSIELHTMLVNTNLSRAWLHSMSILKNQSHCNKAALAEHRTRWMPYLAGYLGIKFITANAATLNSLKNCQHQLFRTICRFAQSGAVKRCSLEITV